MKNSSLWRCFSVGVIAVSICFFAVDDANATGGGAWGGSLGGGSVGGGGCWGGSSGFRTPVRDFFAYRQPVRSLLRGVGRLFRPRGCWGGSYGCGGGYAYYGGGCHGFGSAGSSTATYQTFGSCTGFSVGTPTYAQPTYSAPAYSYPSTIAPSTAPICNDCVGATNSVIDYGSPSTLAPSGSVIQNNGTYNEGAIIATDQNIIPAEQYYDSGNSFGTESGSETEVRGFETPPSPEPATDETTLRNRGDGILNVMVPENTKLYVNDRLTKTVGANRSYVSKSLDSSRPNRFNLKAIAVIDGQEVTLQRTVLLNPGRTTSVAFDFDKPILTQLTVKVPEGAKVQLCGNDTSATGSVRNFKTRLKPGKIWKDYKVEIQFEKNGEMITQSKSLKIEAGSKYVVDFNADEDMYVSK